MTGPPGPKAIDKGGDALPLVHLFADGACSGNPGPGGWAVILVQPNTGRRVEMSGFDPETTNNRMELQGVIEGLRKLRRRSRVIVTTDSRYVVQGMREWVGTWQRNGWRTSDRKPVKNRELWEELVGLSAEHALTFEWTAGHAGHPENERCDQLAVEAIRKGRGTD